MKAVVALKKFSFLKTKGQMMRPWAQGHYHKVNRWVNILTVINNKIKHSGRGMGALKARP